jgi:protein TonB
MPLRCLLFSSDETVVQSIRQVLTDLGIEGEYCQSAVDAVERVTTQLFQIVITDWDDQPEAAFLLKTARDLKAAHRPLTLAIVSDDARLPEALQAGANSVLSKPIRAEQVRDTMSTACELLRATQPLAAPQSPGMSVLPQIKNPAARAAAAPSAAVAAPHSLAEATTKTFRAGEFLQSQSSAPGAQFDTETECDVQKSLDEAAAAEMDALTELEPMASAVGKDPAAVEPQAALTGWTSLQARLTRSTPPAPVEASPKNELLAYGETPSHGAQAALSQEVKDRAAKTSAADAGPEAALFAYIEGEAKEHPVPEQVRPKRGKLLLACVLAFVCVVLAAVPKTRFSLHTFYRYAARTGGNWLSPQPALVPPTVTQHESFGQAGDEYKLPVAANIPDASTDPSQIRVVPVIDPTAKPTNNADTNVPQPSATDDGVSDQKQNEPNDDESGQTQVVENDVKEQPSANGGNVAGSPAAASPAGIAPLAPVQSNPSLPQGVATQPPGHTSIPPVQSSAPPAVSTGNNAAIPSSLRSQTNSMTPEASGAKPVEAAMSSIEPVTLPESSAWSLLAQPVDPVYPDAAKAAGQRGSVVLQLLIGRDGTVQDAKVLQGSLVFARAAIDAVKQWRFKPYSLNGRAVSVQSAITLNFKPPS